MRPLAPIRAAALLAGLLALPGAGLLATTAPVAAQSPSPQVRQLQLDLAQIVREPGWRGAQYGVMVTSVDHGDTLFALNPDVPIAPASVMKIYTTAAALYYLGPDFRFATYALADGELRDGVLSGNVILYGTGNPGIASRTIAAATPAAHAIADTLRALGIRTIEGDVVGDGSYFDDVRLGSGWNAENLLAWYAAPVGALTHGESMVILRVSPGEAPGSPARVVTVPETRGLSLDNRVRTVASGRTSITVYHEGDALVVRGHIPRGAGTWSRFAAVGDPTNYAAATLRAALEDRGIRVLGGTRTVNTRGGSPVTFNGGAVARNGAPRVIAVHHSPTLAEVVASTNQESHNLFAEALLKTVGRVVFGEGSFRAGARAVQYFLECEAGVDPAWLRMVDGSGLSRLNRVTPRSTIHLLHEMTGVEHAEVFRASLPVAAAAQTRSLRNRMGRSPAAGNLRAKTGTIHRVSALAGYVRAANGELLAFAIMGNDVPSTWRMKRMEDAIGIRLAGFSRPRPEPEPVPEPVPEPEPIPEPVPEPEPIAPVVRRPAPVPVTLDPPAPVERVAAPEPAPEPAFREHTVAAGEVLGTIARRYGVTVADLHQANPGLDPRRLQLGQTIRIPVRAREEAASPEARRTHTVARGETMDAIARRYGVSVAALQAANPGVDPRRIQPGQSLVIPD